MMAQALLGMSVYDDLPQYNKTIIIIKYFYDLKLTW